MSTVQVSHHPLTLGGESIDQVDDVTHRTHGRRASGTPLVAPVSVDRADRTGPGQHEGERPIAITWRLEHDLPADLFVEFAAAAVA